MQCVTAVEATWLAEMGPMFYSVKQAGAGRISKETTSSEGTMSTMEEEMKLAQEQMIAEKEEQIKKEASIRKKSVCKFFISFPNQLELMFCGVFRSEIITPGRAPEGTPRRTPGRNGL